MVWRNAKGLHGAGAGAGAGADVSVSSSGGASAVPATQLTELQETELLEAFEALPPRVKGAMKGKGRQGDWRALALDALRAITELEKEHMPPPPPRSSTPVVPTSPPAASAPAPSPRRSARHTPATSSSAAASSAATPVSRRSPRLASSRPAAATTRDVIKPPPKCKWCKCGRPKVRMIDFIEHETFRGTYDWYIEHQDELPQNDWTDGLRGWLGDTDRVFSTCSCEKCPNVVDVCDTFIKLEIYQTDKDRLDDEFGVLCASLKACVIVKHLDWLDANVEKLRQAWWYPEMAVILDHVLTDVEEIKEKRAAPEESIATCVDIDVFRWSKLNRYLRIVDRKIAV